MKILEYIDKQRESLPAELAEILIHEASIWTNEAAYGYCIIAMEAAGYSRKQIGDMLGNLHNAFEFTSVEEAEAKFRNW